MFCIDRSWAVRSGRGGGIIIRDCAKVNAAAMSGRVSRGGVPSTVEPVLPDDVVSRLAHFRKPEEALVRRAQVLRRVSDRVVQADENGHLHERGEASGQATEWADAVLAIELVHLRAELLRFFLVL